MTEQDHSSVFQPGESDPGLDEQFQNISQWGRLIAIIGFGVGAFVVMGMLLGGAAVFKAIESSMLVKVPGAYGILVIVFFIFFFIAAAILYFLYKAAANLRAGVLQKNSTLIAEGFSYLNRFFIISAILSGISLLANISTLFQ